MKREQAESEAKMGLRIPKLIALSMSFSCERSENGGNNKYSNESFHVAGSFLCGF